MPFLTEEIWHALYDGTPPAKSIALTRYPQAADFPADTVAARAMNTTAGPHHHHPRPAQRTRRPRKRIHPHPPPRAATASSPSPTPIRTCSPAWPASASIEFSADPLTGTNARSTADFDVAVIYERQIDVPAERERLTKDLAKYEKGLAAADTQLTNEAFMAKAPAHIVEGLRKQAAETRTLYDKTKSALDALPPA